MNIIAKTINYIHSKISSKALYKIEKNLIYKGALRLITPKTEKVFSTTILLCH